MDHPALTAEDREHLKLLSIFYYIYGALTLIPMLCLGLWGLIVLIGIGAAASQQTATTHTHTMTVTSHSNFNGSGPAVVGTFFTCFFLIAAIFVIAISISVFFAGHSLSRYRNPTFCTVVAALLCLNVPLGTALGVFTLIVLARPTVKAAFANTPD